MVSQFSLVCSNDVQRSLGSSTYMAAKIIGSLVFGVLSDKFGRKIALLGCILVSSSASLAGSFMTDYWSYMVLRLVTASGSVGLFNEAFTMTVELMGSKEVNTKH